MNEFQHDTSSCEVLGLLGIFIILEAIGNPVKTLARSVGSEKKKKKKILEALEEGDFFASSRLGRVD